MSAIDRSSGSVPSRSFRLNKDRGKLMGVSAGIADYFGWDVTLVRIGWVAATLITGGAPILLYLAIVISLSSTLIVVKLLREKFELKVLSGRLTLGVLVASTMVWKASTAAFTASTTNGVNTFSTGTVALSDSDASTSMFTAPPYIAPGDTGEACIRVTYGGSLTSDVRVDAR